MIIRYVSADELLRTDEPVLTALGPKKLLSVEKGSDLRPYAHFTDGFKFVVKNVAEDGFGRLVLNPDDFGGDDEEIL